MSFINILMALTWDTPSPCQHFRFGYYESKLFDSVPEPLMYYSYMDDTFVVFDNERECDIFLEQQNSLHPSLHLHSKKSVTNPSCFLMLR